MKEDQDYFSPIHFPKGDIKDAKYIYDFNSLSIIQAECAKETGEFKYYQSQKDAKDYRELAQSRSAEWLIIAMSYLLNPVVNGVPTKWDPAKIGETEKYIADLPFSEYKNLEACITHFFIECGKKQAICQILQGKGSALYNQALLEQLLTIASTNTSNGNLLKENLKSKTSIGKMKSLGV